MKPADLAVTHHFARLPTLRMHYVEAGEGPLVVLLHGFPESWWSWRYQVQALAEAGFRVIAPDLRGYGDTERHGPYDVDTLAGDVCHLIESLGEQRAKIVGHDWGGAVAWRLASQRPEFCEQVAVLNCPHPAMMQRALLGKRPSFRQLKKSWYFFFFLVPFFPEWALTKDDAKNTRRTISSAAIDRAHFGEDDLRPFQDGIQRPGAAKAMVGWYREAVLDGFRNAVSPKKYQRVTAPTLIVWGMSDPALGHDDLVPGTEEFAPRLQVVQVPQCGHFVHAERPELVNPALISFFRQSTAGAAPRSSGPTSSP